MNPDTLTFDVETDSVDLLWTLLPQRMFRLGGYAWGEGPPQITESLEEMRSVIRSAKKIIGHNIHQFDLIALFGKDSVEPMRLALQDKILDTFADAPVVLPYPDLYTNRFGKQVYIKNPEAAKSFYSLDELAFQLGSTRKTDSIKDLAKKHGGFGSIPLNDPDYRSYLAGDVIASRELARILTTRFPWTSYRSREQRLHGILSQCSRLGIRIDADAARSRISVLEARIAKHMAMLQESFDMPTKGKMPLRSKEGKAAVLAALESLGIPASSLSRTKNGAPSLGADSILAATSGKGPTAEALGESLATISGSRMTASTLLASQSPDGRAHPSITAFQRSARFSFTDPGLTVVGSRGDGAQDKRIIVSSDDHLLVEFDFQAADTRGVCAYSGDTDFYSDYVLADAHTATAKLFWPDAPLLPNGKHPRRQDAKPVTHGSPYGIGADRLHKLTGLTVSDCTAYLKNLRLTYPKRYDWMTRSISEGESTGFVASHWGRALPVDRRRAFTQSTAQLGQNATREMIVDGLLRLAALRPDLVARLVAIIHDAVLFDLPAQGISVSIATIRQCFEATLSPLGGMPVPFPMSSGTPASTWFDASH